MITSRLRPVLIVIFILLNMVFLVSCEVPCEPDCGENGTCVYGICMCDDGYSGDHCQYPQTTTIAGIYTSVPNPCTTFPCLPGVTCSIDGVYHLTYGGSWITMCEGFSWPGYIGHEGDFVEAQGEVTEGREFFGEKFYLMEVTSMSLLPF